jgi:hypothetical protein
LISVLAVEDAAIADTVTAILRGRGHSETFWGPDTKSDGQTKNIFIEVRTTYVP